MSNPIAQHLDKYFDTAFSSPNGIPKLRELILTLAMQGKLVAQDPKDQPASELLKDIEAEKQKLIKEGKIKKPKPLPPIKPEEIPYALPQGWEWVRLGSITDYNGRPNISGNDIQSNTWLLDLEDIEKGTSRLLRRALYSDRQSKSTKSTFQSGDVLYGKLRPYLDKVIVADKSGICTTEIIPIIPLSGVNAYFLRWLLKRPEFRAHVNSLSYGVKMPRLGTEDAVMSSHPLPPLPEQHRIVAKVDQLMARCDELEKLQDQQKQMRTSLHTAAIHQLLNQPDSSACKFMQRHFYELYSVNENIAELRKAILQLAVMGRLVSQDPKDRPASELLKDIEAQKKKLIKEGKIKKPKPLPPIKPEEIPYALPQGWEWVRLGGVISNMDAGWSPKCGIGPAKGNQWGVLKTTAVQSLQFWPHENKVLPEKLSPCPELQVEENDILITRAGPKSRVGICCVATPTRPHLMLSDKIIRFKIYGSLVFPSYCAIALNTGYGSEQLERMKSGMADSQMNISQDKLKQVVISIPPLPEQHRIVAKVDQLMGLCDQLEQEIQGTTNKQIELLGAVLQSVQNLSVVEEAQNV